MTIYRRAICIILFFGLPCLVQAKADAPDSIRPLLKKHCFGCHGPDKQKGDLRLDQLSGAPAEAKTWLKVLKQLHAGEMPPEKKPRPAREELAELLKWIDIKVPAASREFQSIMQRPENGNLVPHDKLFDPKVAAQAPKIAASPARVWRTLPQSYEQKQEAWLNARGVGVVCTAAPAT